MSKIPIIRLEIEALGDHIHAAIMAKGNEVAEEVKLGVRQAADELDIVGIAKSAAMTAIKESVEKTVIHYFAYGKGNQIIADLVGKAINDNT